ncbi:GLoBin related [Ditylenchus destructor]|nr:GLoBin related [Ditylenchus destructor]
MPVFKKLKKTAGSTDSGHVDPLPTSGVKDLDKRLGFDCYRDFYTLKNYWKTVGRKSKEAAKLLLYR